MTSVGGTMTMTCLHKYTTQLQQVLKEELDRAKQEMLTSDTFCAGFTSAQLTTAYINMITTGPGVLMEYGVDLTSYGSDVISAIETCSFQLSAYLSDFSNWRQPILTDIYQCPSLAFPSTAFNVTEVAWQCPT